jgi:hypothetical protein
MRIMVVPICGNMANCLSNIHFFPSFSLHNIKVFRHLYTQIKTKPKKGQAWWLMPVIPAILEVEIERISVQGQIQQKC